jgi:L-lactate utilization protein LutC
VPFDPDRVYQQLTLQLRTPTPPPTRSSNTQLSYLQTSQNPHQFKRQLSTIKRRISQYTGSPLDSVDEVINQISKTYKITANNLILLGKEVHDLQAAHEKEKQKHRQSRKQITHKQGITREEAQALI